MTHRARFCWRLPETVRVLRVLPAHGSLVWSGQGTRLGHRGSGHILAALVIRSCRVRQPQRKVVWWAWTMSARRWWAWRFSPHPCGKGPEGGRTSRWRQHESNVRLPVMGWARCHSSMPQCTPAGRERRVRGPCEGLEGIQRLHRGGHRMWRCQGPVSEASADNDRGRGRKVTLRTAGCLPASQLPQSWR